MRRFISTLSGIVLGLGCFVGLVNAANFSDKSIGISINLDDKLVEQTQWRGYLVFNTPDNSASVLIKPVHNLRLYDLKEDLKGGGYDDVGSIDLVVTGTEKSAQVSQGSGVLVPVKGRIDEHKIRASLLSALQDRITIKNGSRASRPCSTAFVSSTSTTRR